MGERSGIPFHAIAKSNSKQDGYFMSEGSQF